MYELKFLKKGNSLLSGNPIDFQVAITPYNYYVRKQNIYVVVSIGVETSPGSTIYTNIKTQKVFSDDDGLVSFDISSIVDAYLEYFTPSMQLNHMAAVPGQIRNFKVEFTLFNNEEKITSINHIIPVLKAGFAFEYFNPGQSFHTPITEGNLLMITNGNERVSKQDFIFLYFTTTGNASEYIAGTFTINYLLNGVPGSFTDDINEGIDATSEIQVVCLPVGFDQTGLQAMLPPGAIVIDYTYQIKGYVPEEDPTNYFPPIKFTIEQRNFYNSYQLMYRNSLGGLMPLRLRGAVESEADYQFQEATKMSPPSYLKDGNLLEQSSQEYSEESPKFKGDTGFLTKYESDRMRDFFLSKQRWEIKDRRLIPIKLNNKNVKFYGNRDNMISQQIEWQHAFTNNYYTDPIEQPSVCPALDQFFWKQTADDQITVYWAFPFGRDYGRVGLSFPGEDVTQYFEISGNSGSAKIDFVRPASVIGDEVDLTVTAQIICNRYSYPLSLGPTWTELDTLYPVVPPIAIDDVYKIDKGFTTPVVLEGSVLANDYDPNDAPIEVVADSGSTIEGGLFTIDAAGNISYTPPSGSFVGEDSFTYSMRRVGDTDTVEAEAIINVQQVTEYTFAKMVIRNSNTSGSTYNYQTTAEVFICLYSDPACLFPKSVTGLSANYRKNKVFKIQGNIQSDDVTNSSVVISGVEARIYNGVVYKVYPQFSNKYEEITSFTLLAGAGYTVL